MNFRPSDMESALLFVKNQPILSSIVTHRSFTLKFFCFSGLVTWQTYKYSLHPVSGLHEKVAHYT